MSDSSHIETNGVNPVPDSERYGRPFDLFPVWFSWNISIFGITLGIYVFGLGLSVCPRPPARSGASSWCSCLR